MDYSKYAGKYQPITLPNDKITLPEPLLHLSVPTISIDKKRAITPKLEEDPTEYTIFWGKRLLALRSASVLDSYKRFVDRFEGRKLVNVKNDRGGLTNNGITLATWKTYGSDKNGDGKIDGKDLALMTDQDHADILENRFWKAARADEILNPYLAAYVVDWMWGSGPGAFKLMHKALGLKPQAKMTPELLQTLNNDPEGSYNLLNSARKQFYKDIVKKDSSLAVFLRGWLRRADAISLNGFVS